MTKNNSQELAVKYQQQKMDFLDSLHPNDFRNGGSFNQAEIIIDELHKALLLHQENPDEFIAKAVSHLFRENSPAVSKAIELSHAYLEAKLGSTKTKSQFANTPKPPYYAAIFTSQKNQQDTGYAAVADQMEALAAEQSGFLGIESARDKNGFGITVSYWESEEAIVAWKNNAQHAEARQRGNKEWYEHFEVRVAKVERAYGNKIKN